MIQQLIRMESFASVQEVQAGITKLFAKAKDNGKFIRVMRNQKPLGVLIPNNIWESLVEDIEALSSPNYLRDIAASRKSKRDYSLDEVKEMSSI